MVSLPSEAMKGFRGAAGLHSLLLLESSTRTRMVSITCRRADQHARKPSRRLASTLSSPALAPATLIASASTPAPKSNAAFSSSAISRSKTEMKDLQYWEAIVVGSGPAGITVMGNLLEQGLQRILWIDKDFNGGRINKAYREVPSNTKVGLFMDFATAVKPFRDIVSGAIPASPSKDGESLPELQRIDSKSDELQALRALEPTKGCQLSYAADMCLMLTRGLRATKGVLAHTGLVKRAILDKTTQEWRVDVHSEVEPNSQIFPTLHTQRLVLCTGSSPNNDPLPVEIPGLRNLDLDCVLSPSLLATTLSPLGPTEVAVVGASHSAILCLMNLYNLASTSKQDLRIKWLTRHPLRYAEFMDGWILRDNTGLKGEAAAWAKANLEPETMPQSPVAKYITKIQYPSGDEKSTFEQHLQPTDFYVQAIGYSRDPIPELKTTEGTPITPLYDHTSGQFHYERGTPSERKVEQDHQYGSGEGRKADVKAKKIPGLFGAGIAFPERVTDPHGNVEYAVGFFKFMKYIKKVVPSWI